MLDRNSADGLATVASAPGLSDRRAPVLGTLRQWIGYFGDYVVTYAEHGPIRLDRGSALLQRSRGSSHLIIVVAGRICLESDGFKSVLDRRDYALVHRGGLQGYRSDELSAIILCGLADADSKSTEDSSRTPFVTGHATSVIPGALGAFLVDLFRQDVRQFSPEARREVAGILQAIVPPIISELAISEYTEFHRRRRRVAALQFIMSRFTDPDLDQSVVAAHLGVSTRSLQRVFEGEEASVPHHIREFRTQHAVTLLKDRRFRAASVDEISTTSGFGSTRAMRRAVHEATGLTPQELRSAELD